MNAMGQKPDPERGSEPEIILVGIEKSAYYLYQGEDHLNELLLADGDYPKPVLCVHFEDMFECNRVVGETFSPTQNWAIHPEIVARLRRDKILIETDARDA